MAFRQKSRFDYVIGTGWWCPEHNERGAVTGRRFFGSDAIRSEAFHDLWYESIHVNTSPRKILIVDSASPVAPPFDERDDRIEHIRLPFNAGHSTHHLGQWSGWMRSVLCGLQYALVSEAEYFVYVEQDVLLHGRGIVEHCIAKMKKPLMFGSGTGTPQVLQQSFFIVRQDAISRFCHRLGAIRPKDNVLSPEDKFAIATSPLLYYNSHFLSKLEIPRRQRLLRRFSDFDHLPVGYGRSRPIDFSEPFFYFQHASDSELISYRGVSDI